MKRSGETTLNTETTLNAEYGERALSHDVSLRESKRNIRNEDRICWTNWSKMKFIWQYIQTIRLPYSVLENF